MEARNKSLKQRLAEAYALLWHAPEDEYGSRTISLERYGHCDVRLVEVTLESPVSAAKSLWLELYDHDSRVSLDSCKCDGIEDAAITAQELISLAKGKG